MECDKYYNLGINVLKTYSNILFEKKEGFI